MAISTEAARQAVQQAHPVLDGASGVLRLPPELVLEILEFLDPAYVVLFSLTCKAAFNLFRRAPFSKSHLWSISTEANTPPWGLILRHGPMGPSRGEFLELLTYDHPHLFICQRCLKLHKYPTSECRLAQHTAAWIRDRRNFRPKGLMTFGPLWPQYAFTFDEARAVVERACNGPQYGLPLSHFSISTNWKLARLGTACSNPEFLHGYVKLDTEAVVVGGCLFFHRIHRILLLPEKVMPLVNRITTASILGNKMGEVFTYCHHKANVRDAFDLSPVSRFWHPFTRNSVSSVISSVITNAQRRVGLPEPAGLDGWDLDAFSTRVYSFSGCCKCTTDYAITVHNHGRAGVEIVSDAIQDLGHCANPNDCKWEQCWYSALEVRYHDFMDRQRHYPMIGLEMFPTRPGVSAIKHPSAPTISDLWDTHEHERHVRTDYVKSMGPGYKGEW
ncbi:hypothetical protein F5Y06DRAFT_263249 [Hypoxylon sp. FL0890]|nr:hypothetical protein F5Y06DRAFT_263249 [Hypoxylon sp. FL0890]